MFPSNILLRLGKTAPYLPAQGSSRARPQWTQENREALLQMLVQDRQIHVDTHDEAALLGEYSDYVHLQLFIR